MTWTEIVESPYLKDLPFKIELNEWTQVVMTPVSNYHGYFQGKIGALLENQKSAGEASAECSVQTSKNVKVPDAVWMSSEFIAANSFGSSIDTPLASAPELCVEVVSPSNASSELEEKPQLYFERGAVEVWLCSEKGEMRFFDHNGEITQSVLFPDFPRKIKTPI